MSLSNLYVQFRRLLPAPPLLVGEVISSGSGIVLVELPGGDRITVRRSQHQVRFLHPEGWNYFDTLRKKMHWNEGA